ncbi:hypothetical protein PMAYCL1PPCAC_14705, partial [Pristionchus mayeri]
QPQYHHGWPWQGRQGTRDGRQAPSQDSQGPHPGNHEAGDPSSGASRRRQTHLKTHLQRDARSAQALPREGDRRRGYLHRPRQEEDGHGDGRCLRAQMPGPHSLRVRRISHGSRSAPPLPSSHFYLMHIVDIIVFLSQYCTVSSHSLSSHYTSILCKLKRF